MTPCVRGVEWFASERSTSNITAQLTASSLAPTTQINPITLRKTGQQRNNIPPWPQTTPSQKNQNKGHTSAPLSQVRSSKSFLQAWSLIILALTKDSVFDQDSWCILLIFGIFLFIFIHILYLLYNGMPSKLCEGPFCVESVCSRHICAGFYRILWFPPTVHKRRT